MSTPVIIALTVCVPLAAMNIYFQRRAWIALWIGLRGIPSSFVAGLKGDPEGSVKGLADAVRYLDGEDAS
jgi:hypothetical protein